MKSAAAVVETSAGGVTPTRFFFLLFGFPLLVAAAVGVVVTALVAWRNGLSRVSVEVAATILARYGYWVIVAVFWLWPTLRSIRLLLQAVSAARNGGITLRAYLALPAADKLRLTNH